jgi:hypothetical protein
LFVTASILPGLDERRLARLLERHPIAEKHIDVAVFERLEGNSHRENRDVRLVAKARQNLVRDLRGGGNVGPADIRKMRFGAGGRIGGIDGRRDKRRR